jgi:hypothetical protein
MIAGIGMAGNGSAATKHFIVWMGGYHHDPIHYCRSHNSIHPL